MERHIDGSKLYHRRCLREHQRSARSSGGYQIGKSLDNQPKAGKENATPAPTSVSSGASLLSQLHGGPKPYTSTVSKDTKEGESSTILNMLSGSSPTYGAKVPSGHLSPNSGPHIKERTKQDSPKQSPRWGRDKSSPGTAHKQTVLNRDKQSDILSKEPGRTQAPTNTRQWSSPSQNKSMVDDSSKVSQFMPNQIHSNQGRDVSHSQPINHSNSGTSSQPGQKPSVLSGLLSSLADVRKKQSPSDTNTTVAKSESKVQNRSEADASIANKSKPVKSEWGDVTKSKPGTVSSRVGASATTDRYSPKGEDIIQRKPTTNSPKQSPRNQHPQRQARATSPRSILKQSSSEENKVSPRGATSKHVKLSSPFLDRDKDTKPILKQDAISFRSRSSSPPKSILKSLDGSPCDDVRLPSQLRGILKSKESLEDMETDEVDDQRPRPILKSVRSHSADGVEGLLKGDERFPSPVRSILKQHTDSDPDLQYEGDSPPRSILKNSQENLFTGKDGDVRMKRANKGHGSMDSDDEKFNSLADEIAQVTGNRVKGDHRQDIGKGTAPTTALSASPPKSILKKKSPDLKPVKAPQSMGSSGPVLAKSVWQAPVPKAAKSSGVPQVSSSFSTNRSRSSSDQQTSSCNNFSAFNLNDSFSLTGDSKSDETSPPKSAWQIEMEARQGMRPKQSNLADQLAKQMEEAMARKAASSNPTEASSKAPEWQIEAERRHNARKGKYDDPEFQRTKSPNAPHKSPNMKLDRPLSPPAKPTQIISHSQPSDNTVVKSPQAPPRKGKKEPPRPKPTYTSVFDKKSAVIENPSGVTDRPYSSHVNTTSSPTKPTSIMPSYGGMDLASIISRQKGRAKGPAPPPPTSPPPPIPQRTPPRDRSDSKGALNRSPAFRIPDSPTDSDKEMKLRSNSTSSTSSDTDSPRSPR